jgi:hypothetical protein
MFITVLVIFAVVIIGFVIVVALQPSAFRITRSATIPAPASVLFAELNDFHRWEAWSPWAKLDPNAKNTYAGTPSGVGASMHWDGNSKVGEGRMTNVESRPDKLVRIKLEFMKPFKATNAVEFTFEPTGEQTLVTWSMSGTNSFVGKAMVLLMNCDKMVGDMYEKGLANLQDATKRAIINQ